MSLPQDQQVTYTLDRCESLAEALAVVAGSPAAFVDEEAEGERLEMWIGRASARMAQAWFDRQGWMTGAPQDVMQQAHRFAAAEGSATVEVHQSEERVGHFDYDVSPGVVRPEPDKPEPTEATEGKAEAHYHGPPPVEPVVLLEMPLRVRGLDHLVTALEAQYGKGLTMIQEGRWMAVYRPEPGQGRR